MYKGYLDAVSDNLLKGWIWRIGDSSPVQADVLVDGSIVDRVLASEYRGDLRRAGVGDGAHSFRWQIPERFFDNRTHTFELEIAEDCWRLPEVFSETLLFGDLSVKSTDVVGGWFRSSGEIGREVRLLIDGVLAGRSSRTEKRVLGSGQKGETFEFRVPHRWLDGREHEIWIDVVIGSETRTLGPIRATLDAGDATVGGRVSGLKRNLIEGQVFHNLSIEGVREVALMLDGLEEVRTRTQTDGRFFLPVITLPVIEWIRSKVEVICLPEHVPLSYDGRHIVADAVKIEINPKADEYLQGTVHSEFALSTGFDLEAYAGDKKVGAIRLSAASAERRADFRLPLVSGLEVDATGLHFMVNGVPVTSATAPSAGLSTTAERFSRPRMPSLFVPPDDPDVRARLQELALGEPEKKGDLDAPPISGSWHFVPPDRVEGWALDLASPAEPLSVTLYVNGQPVQSRTARQMIQPTETQISFEVPVGFTFVLPLLPHSRCELEVRPQGGGSLAPHKPRVIRLDARQSSGAIPAEVLNQTRETIDHHVAAGRLIEAYLLARRFGGAASIDARHLVLDFTLRSEWHTYDDALNRWNTQGYADPRLLQYLRSASLGRRERAAHPETEPFLFSGSALPSSYARLLEMGGPEPNADDCFENIEKSLVWRALETARANDSIWPEPTRIGILYILGEVELGALYVRYLVEAAARGVAVEVLLGRAKGNEESLSRLAAAGVSVSIRGSEVITAATADAFAVLAKREFVIVSRRAGIYGAGALCLWPSILDRGDASLTFAAIAYPQDLALAGRMDDSQSTLLRNPTAESLFRYLEAGEQGSETISQPRAGELIAYVPPPKRSSTARLIVLHEFAPDQHLPLSPAGTAAFSIRGRQVVMDRRELSPTEFGQIVKERHGASDATPVVFLANNLIYPRDYLRECLRLWRMHKEAMRISLLPLEFHDIPQAFSISENRSPSFAFFALLPASCLFLRDLSVVLEEAGNDCLILRRDQPFLTLPFLGRHNASSRSVKRILSELDRSNSARQKGFVGTALAQRSDPLSSLPSSVLRVMSSVAREKASFVTGAIAALANPAPSELTVSDLERLLSLGRRDLAEGLLLKNIARAETIREAPREKIETILSGAKLLGLQAAVGAQLRPHAESLVSRLPSLVTPLFECLAVALPEGDFTAALFSCMPALATAQSANRAFQLADLCRKYCSPGAFLTFLFAIDSSRNQILFEERFASLVGDALLAGELGAFILPNSRLDAQFFLEAAPLERRLLQATVARDRESVVTLADRLLSRSEGGNALLRTLRTYSSELSELSIGLNEIGHSFLLSAREQLMLAGILGDKKYIAPRLASVHDITADAVIVAAASLDDYELLERNYERWATEAGVMPVRFRGDSIWSMFENFAVAKRPEPSNSTTDKVSVIMSVYNPDLDLLRLAIISVLQQTHSNFELLLMDDASDYGDTHRIEALGSMDERISFFRTPRNQGPYLCRNRALEFCQGTYVAIQDGDDYSHPQRLERQVAALRENPVLEFCTASHLRIDRHAHLQFEHGLGVRGDGVMSSMFRRSLVDCLGPFAEVRSRGDVEFRERIRASHGSHALAHIECPLIFCYATPHSLSNRTARNFVHFLSLFRESFQMLRRDRFIPGEVYPKPRPVVAPWPLRP